MARTAIGLRMDTDGSRNTYITRGRLDRKADGLLSPNKRQTVSVMSTDLSKWYQSRSAMFVLAAIVWLGALIILVLYCPKYLPAGGSLLSTDFENIHMRGNDICTDEFGCWTCTENGVLLVKKAGFRESIGVRLTPAGKYGSSILWDFQDPRRFAFFELKGRMRVEDIREGKEPWDIARCLLYFKDWEGKRRWNYPHTAKGLSGSSPWIEFSKVFPVPDFAVSAHVLILNSAKSGSMWIDDISLRPLRVNHQFFRDRNILLGLGVILLFAFVFTLKIWKDFGWVIPVIILAGALGVLCRNAHFEEIASVLNMRAEVLKKIGHFIVFFAMGTSSSLWLQRRSTTRGRLGVSIYHAVCLFAALALFAALTELLQLLTLDRTPRLTDYFIDLSGILLGVLLVFIIGKTYRIRPSKP